MDPRVIWTPPLENIWYLLERTHSIFHKKRIYRYRKLYFQLKLNDFIQIY